MSKNRALTAAIVAFAVTGSVGSVIYIQSARKSKRRRALRSASGARTEVVVLAGAVASPLASNLALDLERRGYIVYSVVGRTGEESFVRGLQRIDLLTLKLDVSNVYMAAEQIARFKSLLEKDHKAFETAEPHKLSLKGLILVPETSAVSSGRVEELGVNDWSTALDAKVLHTIATTQLFLPLLKEHAAKLLLLTPSISSSLQLPGHAIENSANAALGAFFGTLIQELKGTNVSVSQFKLGALDIPSQAAKQRREGGVRTKATPLRKLHDSVFDALAATRPAATWYVGQGSLTYAMVGKIVPTGLVSWMLQLAERRRQKHNAGQSGQLAIEDGSSTWERIEKEV